MLPNRWQSQIHFRKAEGRDWWQICKVESACFGWERLLFGLWRQVFNRTALVWLVETRGTVVGYLIAYPRKFGETSALYVGGIGVLPAVRRYGLGNSLMQRVLIGQTVWLHVREGNAPATLMYEKLGMKTLSRLQRFYTNGEDALVLGTPDLLPTATITGHMTI